MPGSLAFGLRMGGRLRRRIVEKLANGAFTSDLTGWTTSGASNGSVAWDTGAALITSSGGTGYPYCSQGVTTVIGRRYRAEVSWTANTTGVWIRKADSVGSGGGNVVSGPMNDKSAAGSTVIYFTATATTSYLNLFAEQADAGSVRFEHASVTGPVA